MKVYKQKKWQYEVTGFDGKATLFGVNIINYEWENTGKKIEVKDPLYGQKYVFPIYRVVIKNQEYEFASGEFSNCVFGFYVQKYQINLYFEIPYFFANGLKISFIISPTFRANIAHQISTKVKCNCYRLYI